MHHAPWAGDGGNLDTRYILQCLPLLLSSSVYEPVKYDVILFNAGLHDVDCCNFPKEVKRQMKIRLPSAGLSLSPSTPREWGRHQLLPVKIIRC